MVLYFWRKRYQHSLLFTIFFNALYVLFLSVSCGIFVYVIKLNSVIICMYFRVCAHTQYHKHCHPPCRRGPQTAARTQHSRRRARAWTPSSSHHPPACPQTAPSTPSWRCTSCSSSSRGPWWWWWLLWFQQGHTSITLSSVVDVCSQKLSKRFPREYVGEHFLLNNCYVILL